MATTIPNCGTYLIEAYAVGAAPANAFKLDYSALDSAAVLGGAVWYDISAYIQNVNIFRGRQNPFRDSTVAPNRASFKIYDPNFYFSVVNTASPYWNTTDGRLSIGVATPVRISRDGEYLFVGQITTFDQNILKPNYATVDVTCSDVLNAFDKRNLPAYTPTTQSYGDRLNTVLDLLGACTGAGERNISTGVCTLGTKPIEENAGARDYLLRVQNCEQGRIFISRGGAFTAQPRVLAAVTNPLVTLSDTGTNIPYQTFDIANN